MAGVPDGSVGLHQFSQEVDVADGEAQGVHFGKAFLVRQSGDVRAQTFKRVVNGLHASAFAHVGSLAQLLHLLLRPRSPAPLQLQRAVTAPRGKPGHTVRRRRGGRGGGRREATHVTAVVFIARTAVLVVFLDLAREKVDVVVQEVVRVHVLAGASVCEEIIVVEIRGGERVQA